MHLSEKCGAADTSSEVPFSTCLFRHFAAVARVRVQHTRHLSYCLQSVSPMTTFKVIVALQYVKGIFIFSRKKVCFCFIIHA